MIAKCCILLAALLQINAYKSNQEMFVYSKSGQPSVNNAFEYSYQAPASKEKYQRVFAYSPAKHSNECSNASSQHQSFAYKKPAVNSQPILRNLVARGKYPVALQNCGPAPEKKIPVMTSHIRVPVQERPTVRLPSKIPAPKTIAHTCTCFQTIVKPRVQQHIITVPSIHRYIETTHRPVIENIFYEGQPISCGQKPTNSEESQQKSETPAAQSYQVQTAEIPRIQTFQIPKEQVEKLLEVRTFEMPRIQVNDDSSKVQRAQIIEIPRVQFVEEKKRESEMPRLQYLEAQQPQKIEIPRVQFYEEKKSNNLEMPQNIQLPRVQFIDSQKSETFEIPRVQFIEEKKPQTVEMQNVQFREVNKPQTLELPRMEFLTQKLQTVEIPRIQVEESGKYQNSQAQQEPGPISLGTGPFTFQFAQ